MAATLRRNVGLRAVYTLMFERVGGMRGSITDLELLAGDVLDDDVSRSLARLRADCEDLGNLLATRKRWTR